MGPFILASALSRIVMVHCPHCAHPNVVARRPIGSLTCARCYRRFVSPSARSG